jgi:hypothetical protein
MIRNSGVRLQIFAASLAFFVSTLALQSVVAGPLFPNALAVPGFSGTVPLLDAGNANLHYGDVEFAVFTSANFALAFPGQDTPNGGVAAGESVYAYQFYNNGAKGDITQFSAGLADIGPPVFPLQFGDGNDDFEAVNAGDQDYIAGTGQDPNLTSVIASAIYGATNGSSVRYNFVGAVGNRVNAGEWSSILFYTSPSGPRWDNGGTTSGSGQSRIPAPEFGINENGLPEPTSFVLAALGMLAWFGCGRRR